MKTIIYLICIITSYMLVSCNYQSAHKYKGSVILQEYAYADSTFVFYIMLDDAEKSIRRVHVYRWDAIYYKEGDTIK